MKRRLLVLGPVAQVLIVVAVLLTALAFYAMGDRLQVGVLIGSVASRILSLLPVARGRPSDLARIVERAQTNPPTEKPPWKP